MATNLLTVTGTLVDFIGGIMFIFTSVNPQSGATRSTRQLVYVSRSAPYPFLSWEACCADLGTIPAIGSCDTPAIAAAASASPSNPCTNTGMCPDQMSSHVLVHPDSHHHPHHPPYPVLPPKTTYPS